MHDFIDIVSKNGQLLLNISPKSDGSIPEDQRAVLKKLGEWMKVNGDYVQSWKQEHDGLKITLKMNAPKQIAYAFKVR